MTFLVTEFGRPLFRDQCDQANLHPCSAHGLRKATAAALAEAGATAHEITAVTGHMSLEEIGALHARRAQEEAGGHRNRQAQR